MFIPVSSQKYICSTEQHSFDLKSNFHIFKTYKDKKQLEISLGKNPENYETKRNKTSVFEQKPIMVDDFNEIEEKQVEKQKQKRGEVAEKTKLLNKKRKPAKSKEDKKKMWEHLGELNTNFKEIKKSKKE